MPNRSKQKGNRFERLVVEMTKDSGLAAKRAWGSNGEAMGEHEEVDVLIGKSFKIQTKCRKKIATWMTPSENVDAQVIKADRENPLIVMRYDDWLELYKMVIS